AEGHHEVVARNAFRPAAGAVVDRPPGIVLVSEDRIPEGDGTSSIEVRGLERVEVRGGIPGRTVPVDDGVSGFRNVRSTATLHPQAGEVAEIADDAVGIIDGRDHGPVLVPDVEVQLNTLRPVEVLYRRIGKRSNDVAQRGRERTV